MFPLPRRTKKKFHNYVNETKELKRGKKKTLDHLMNASQNAADIIPRNISLFRSTLFRLLSTVGVRFF